MLAVGGAAVVPSVADAACTPTVMGYGYAYGYSHDGARIFVNTVDVYNGCWDTTWYMDIRPLTSDRAISPQTGIITKYAISSSYGYPWVAGFYAR